MTISIRADKTIRAIVFTAALLVFAEFIFTEKRVGTIVVFCTGKTGTLVFKTYL